jgi:DNA repair protein RadC
MSASKPQQAKPHYHGHRDRLRQRLLDQGGGALADYEIIEFLLFAATPRADTKPLAKALIKRFGSLSAVLSAEPAELAAVSGLGQASIAALKIVPEAARRLAREQVLGQPVLSSWSKLLDYCRIALAHEKVERFHLHH